MGKFREIADPTYDSEKRNAENFHCNRKSGPWNDEHVEAASREMKKPIGQIIGSVRERSAGVYLGAKNIVKDTVTGTLSLASNIVTGTVAAPFKITRWALDLLKIPAVLLIAGVGATARTAGKPSAYADKTNKFIHRKIGRPIDNPGASDDLDMAA